jgi:hypothetical protein
MTQCPGEKPALLRVANLEDQFRMATGYYPV